MWIYEQNEWPVFEFKTEELHKVSSELRISQNFLNGCMHVINQIPANDPTCSFKIEANLDFLTNSVINSSAIEGVHLDREEVRSSIARSLYPSIKRSTQFSDKVEGIVKLTLDATQNYHEPLTTKRLFKWHEMLFPKGHSGSVRITVGKWRLPENDPMQILSGYLGRERVHYEAPNAETVDSEMTKFLTWFEKDDDVDLIIKAGISHLWFESIHPFEDGNGRIGRAICDLALARAFGSSNLYFSLSSQFADAKSEYYKQLEAHQRGNLIIDGWLNWFLECLEKAMQSSLKCLEKLMAKARTLDYYRQFQTNERQNKIIEIMLGPEFEGFMNSSRYAKITKCLVDTALKDITELAKFGILLPNPGKGKKMSYRLYVPKKSTS